MEIFFTEALQSGLSSIAVYDSGGLAVDVGDVRVDPADPTRMTVSLHSLTDGVYTVSWKAISAADGHFSTGSFPFAVGNVDTSKIAAVQQTSSASLPFSALLAKWMLLAALALLAGQFPFTALVWNPALKPGKDDMFAGVREPAIWRTIYRVGWIVFALGMIIALLSQAGEASGSELAVPWSAEAGVVLTGSRLGLAWLARLGLLVAGVWLTESQPRPWKNAARFLVALALLLTMSLISHAATEARPFLPVTADWLHLLGMCVWFGGLAYLFTGLRALHQVDGQLRTGLVSATVTRFSLMALSSVAVIGATGLYAAYLRVGSLEALNTTLYGHALYFKQGFVVALLALAAVNLLFISPRLKHYRETSASNIPLVARFEGMVRGEIILACLLLLVVSVLTYLPPAKSTPPSSDLTGSANANDLQMDIRITPGYVGQNTFTLHLTSNGQPVQSVKEALLRFTPSQGNIPPSDVQLIGQGNGDFVTQGSYLSLPSNWQVQAIVRRDKAFDAYANFDFSVNNPGANNTDAQTARLAGGLILFNGLLFAAFAFFSLSKPALRFGVGGTLSLLLIVAGGYYLLRPLPSANNQANPIVPDARSIAAGQATFSNYCAPCHGVFGKGDGPLGLTLNPRPADLTLHAIPGVHTDAQLFEWISNGFPGSRMPAFKEALSDTDRWNLVNFIRTMAPK